MPDLSDSVNWSEVDANNNRPSPNGWPEGMMPSAVNDTGRANKGALKRFWDKINPVQTITPSAGVWTFTTSNVAYPTAYVTGEVYYFKAAVSSNSIGGDQFAVNALGGKPIWKRVSGGWTAIIAQDILGGLAAQLIYDATLNAGVGAFILLNPFVPIFGNGGGGVSIPGGLTVTGGLTAVNNNINVVSGDSPMMVLSNVTAPILNVAVRNSANQFQFALLNSSFGYLATLGYFDSTGNLTIASTMSAIGYRSRSGLPGPYQGNYCNIQWNGSQAHLWVDNSDIGPIVTGSAGSVVIGGNVSAGSITSSGNITGGSINSSGDITAAGNFHQNGNYHLFAGSGGTVNSTGGPLIYGDVNAIVLKPGNGTIGVEFQNYAGTNTLVVSNSGNMSVAGNISGAGTITAAQSLNSTGSNAGVTWQDRSNTSLYWLWYTTGGIARLWNSAAGDRITIDSSGNLAANSVNASSLTGVTLQVNGNATVTGALQLNGGATIGGTITATNITASGNITATGVVTVGGASAPTLVGGGNYMTLYASDAPAGLQACFILGKAADPTNYSRNTYHHFDNRDGSFTYAVFSFTAPFAFKPGGGTWGDTSDIRLKHSIGDYTAGLEQVARLRPVRYRFNGRGGTTDDGHVFTGLIADEVQDVMPEMVGTMPAKLNPGDDHDTDILTLDATSLIYALVNSVKELANRLTALETNA